MSDADRIAAANARYEAAAHAMQTGVAWEMEHGSKDTTPKHLRTGVNSALCDSAALARLLIDKGVFTEVEYVEAIADEMERERDRYQSRLPSNVTLA